MKRLLPVLLIGTLVACGRPSTPGDDPSPPFVFRSLNLRQQDSRGQPAWELTSPEARYDIRRRVAQALQPRGVIYAEGKPLYRVEASSGVVLNDGDVIQLEGKIRLQRLGAEPVLIRASQVRWLPSQRRMELDRHPEALDRHNRLVAEKARFLLDKEVLELRGKPRLERWAEAFQPSAGPPGAAETVLTVAQLDWHPGSGRLEAAGPVQATRRPRGRAGGLAPQTLSASGLQGNTREQRFSLLAPVRFDDLVEGTTLTAQQVEVMLEGNRIRTDAPFSGQRQDLQVRGQSLRLSGNESLVEIPAGCLLDRPGESLRAGRCLWNWSTETIEAAGDVELQRSTNSQSIRAERLSGRLGSGGSIEASSPGGRVVSRFRVPPPRRL